MEISSKSGIIGAIVGDALGVPYEFQSRAALSCSPADDMVGFGTHNQPPGTWSDDSSLILCTLDSLIEGYDLNRISKSFVDWLSAGIWTPHGEVFDIGMTTRDVINRLSNGEDPLFSGEMEEHNNGNGALMRILPVSYHLRHEEAIGLRFQTISEVSAISHAHIRSRLCCFYYSELALQLMATGLLENSIEVTNELFRAILHEKQIVAKEVVHYERLLSGEIGSVPENEIQSSGYVMHTLEASIWCLLNSSSFAEAVLKAVNLGEDTDTTATVTGGLAGILYGFEGIPDDWVQKIVRLDDIFDLIGKFDVSSSQA